MTGRNTVRATVTGAADALLRTALLTKLALDLSDPVLARCSARQAVAHAHLLAGLDVDLGDGYDDLPDVADLLEVLYPATSASGDDEGDAG